MPDVTTETASAEEFCFRDSVVELLPQLRAFARALTGNRDRADDLVHETIVRALNAERQFQPGTNLRAWLFTILRNQHISIIRRRRAEVTPLDDLPDSAVATPAAQLSNVEFKQVARVLADMPIAFREALVLVGGAGLSYEEAAAVCGCAVGTIKSRVSRARRDLHRQMGAAKPESLFANENAAETSAEDAAEPPKSPSPDPASDDEKA